VLGRSSKFREPLGAQPTLVVVDRFTNMFDLGGNRKGSEEGFEKPPTPPPTQQTRANENDSIEDYSLVSNQRSALGAGPPTRAVEFTFRGSNDPGIIRGAAEVQSRRGDEEVYYREPKQASLGQEGQETESTEHHPGTEPHPGGQVQKASGSNKPYVAGCNTVR